MTNPRFFHNQYRSAETIMPDGYETPLKPMVVVNNQLIGDTMNLEVIPLKSTVVPDGYIPCPSNEDVHKFQPYIKWRRYIDKVQTTNVVKAGGLNYRELKASKDDLLEYVDELMS